MCLTCHTTGMKVLDLDLQGGSGSSGGDESDDEAEESLVAARAARREAKSAAKHSRQWLRPTPQCMMVSLGLLVLLAQVSRPLPVLCVHNGVNGGLLLLHVHNVFLRCGGLAAYVWSEPSCAAERQQRDAHHLKAIMLTPLV